MPVLTRDTAEAVAGDRLPVFRATSNNLSGGTGPFRGESGLINPKTGKKVPGIFTGFCGPARSGGMFFYDEWQLYQAGIINSTNIMVFGDVGFRKSAFVKTFILRGAAYGYNHLVTDLKGEYDPLAKAIEGAQVLRFGVDTNLFINPLDSAMDLSTQQELVGSMALTAMGQGRPELNEVERALLWHAIADAHRGRDEAILPQLVELLFSPSQAMADGMHRPIEVVREQGYALALALQRLTERDLRGMFHERTTEGLLSAKPLQVLNCANLSGDAAAVMIILINFFTQSVFAQSDPHNRIHKIFHDEAWDLSIYPGFVRSIRRSFKLSGTYGVSNTLVTHHLANLERSAGSQVVKDLVTDSETAIVFRQDKQELEQSAELLSLKDAEVARIPDLPPGRAIYKIGDLPGIEVEHIAFSPELPLLETRHLLKGEVPASIPSSQDSSG